jgi:DNA-binding GntR family transcriptional regulator
MDPILLPSGPVSLAQDAVDVPLVDRLAATIHARVLSGAIVRGTRLPQEALAAEFGVSRTPVREALRKLQAAGVVELLPHRGAVVRGPSAREIRESYEVRTELEGLAAELATARIGDADLQRLRDAERLFRTSVVDLVAGLRRRGRDTPWGENDAWVRANDLFHQAILEAAGNHRLAEVMGDLRRSFPRELTWSALSANSRRLEENVLQHGEILDAIERRDAGAARLRMIAHVRAAGELVLHHFETVGDARA